MKNETVIAALLTGTAMFACVTGATGRDTTTFQRGWKFAKVDENGKQGEWQNVRVPHDWAVHEPFSRDNDLQVVAVEQNGETEKTEKTGRTGGLPYMGRGVYTTQFNVADTTGQTYALVFDGAMSNPSVTVNGKHVGGWAYGYNSFYLNLPDGVVKPGENSLKVELENKPMSSRWYPGAGLYRNVHLVATSKIHVPVWGTYLTTPYVSTDEASVKLITNIEGAKKGEAVRVDTEIIDPSGKTVATNSSIYYSHGQPFTQNFLVEKPMLWDTETPNLYIAKTTLSVEGKAVDEYTTRFGIRSLEYIPEKGFFLNGKYTKFKGVCNHHDLGPLGAAEMAEQYRQANVFVCPSSIENSPNSLGEAQLIGCPVVASNVGGVADMVADGLTGLLYRFEETEMLAEAVCRMFGNDALAASLSAGGIRAASERHDGDRNAREMLEIYKSIAESERQRYVTLPASTLHKSREPESA